MGNNVNIDVKVFEQRANLNDFLGFNNPAQNQQTGTSTPIKSELDGIFALWDAPTNSNNNGAFANINSLFANQTPPTKVENYGGFQFKNSGEQTSVDQALAELRQQQAANPGKAVSKTIKVGKYKLTINLKEDGTVSIKRKKKHRGLFGGLGKIFKGIGNILKKALPIVSMVAMFIPGLQPLALAARVASGFMGVVDGIKNGNIFGALTSAVGAFSGIGGKIGGMVSNLTSKASGVLNSIGGAGSSWFSNAVSTASSFVSKAKDVWSGFTSGIGTKVSDFVFNNGSGIFGNAMSQGGSSLLKSFADSIGNRAVNFLDQTANGILNRTIMNNPVGQGIGSFLNSGFGQTLMEYLKGKQV